MNTELREKATSDFEKNLYKLINNSVLGKTMEKFTTKGLMSSWFVPKRKTNSGILSPAQPLQEPTSSTMILQQSRCIRFV